MFKHILDLVLQDYSGDRAKRHVEELARYHRIQASPGLRAAAGYAYDHLRGLGLQADILRFAGDGVTHYLSALMPQEWRCQSAQLRLLDPEGAGALLADYGAEKMSLIQRSAPTPPEGVTAEVVVLADGSHDADYDGLDVAGKLVLTKGNVRRVHDLAVQRRGAAGIIFDGMREQPPVRNAFDLAEARQYTSFWWRPEDRRCFGFVLSPRQGEELRRLCCAAQSSGKAMRLHASVDSSFVNGFMDAPTALIPGATEEEILVVAHICHPQPSANDNASGVAAVLEMARVVQSALAAGKLPPLRRSIRILLPPEMYGTYAYLASDDRRQRRTLAAINLDMVGENQDLCGSSFLVESPPRAMSAPVDALAIAIQESLAHEYSGLSQLGSFALFRYGHVPFNGGSDHYILSDPSIGIPCPMLIQWPDRFYHTSFDTVDKVDPASLRRAGALAATYAVFLAAAGPEEVAWLAREAQTRYRCDIARLGQGAATAMGMTLTQTSAAGAQPDGPALALDLDRLQRRLLFESDRHQESLGWLAKLGGAEIVPALRSLQSEAAMLAWSEWTAQQETVGAMAVRAGLRRVPEAKRGEEDDWQKQAQNLVPVRTVAGPISLDSHLSRLTTEQQDAWYGVSQAHKATPETVLDLALFWADGRRTLAEIARLVELETGVADVEYMLRYLRLLAELGLITIAAPGQQAQEAQRGG